MAVKKFVSDPKLIRTCSICRALDVVGDKPTLLILERYWLGARRFSSFQKQTGLLKTVISDRLKKLVDTDCFEKVQYSERPKRFEYRGTQKFYDMYPIALAMLRWEQDWGERAGKTEIALVHKSCGKTCRPQSVCRACRREINPLEIGRRAGPGAGMMPATYQRRRRANNSKSAASGNLFDDVIDIMGDRWSALIIRSVFTGIKSYQNICDDTGIATNILAERLSELIEKDVIKKQAAEYKLTPKGQALYPILLALMEWGDKWHPIKAGPPLCLIHKPCDTALIKKMACSECGEDIRPEDMSFEFVETEKPIKQA